MTRLALVALACVPVALFLMACDSGASRSTSSSPSQVGALHPESELPAPGQVTDAQVREAYGFARDADVQVQRLETGAYREPFGSLSEMTSRVDVVALVTPLQRKSVVYPEAAGRREVAWTLFLVRVDEVIKGSVSVGDILTVAIVGGPVADRDVPAMGPASLVPGPADRVVVRVFDDYPLYVPGRQELAFLGSYVHPQFGEQWWGSYGEGRYVVTSSGQLVAAASAPADGATVRNEVAGRTVSDIRGFARP